MNKEFLRILESRLNAFWTMALDSILLIIWGVLQYLADYYLAYFNLQGSSLIIQRVIQVLFGIVTIASIANNVYADVRILIIKTRREIERAEKEGR